MKSLNAIVVYLLASMSVGGVAAADPLLVNGSFESGLTGWTSTATVLNYSGPYPVDYSAFHVNAPDGLWYLFLGGRDAFGYIEQTITGLEANTRYEVDFLMAAEDIGDFFTVSMTSGSSSPSQLFTAPPESLGAWRVWLPTEYQFVTGSSATQATLRFTSAPLGSGIDHFDIALDDVSVRVVPEPATFVLVLLVLVLLAFAHSKTHSSGGKGDIPLSGG